MPNYFNNLDGLELEITTYLFKNCKGKSNSITYKELSEILLVGSRDLRRTVSQLVTDGKACIGSTSKNGYFYVDTDEEAEHVQKELRKRALKTLVRRRGFMKARKIDKQIEANEISEQLSLMGVG